MSASVIAALVVALKWVAVHPAETLMSIGALASMLVGWLEKKWPKLAKVAVALAQMGVNVPGLLNSLKAKAPALIAKEAAQEAAKLSGK